MAGGGDLDTVRNQSGEVLYRQCAQPAHHHHLVCRQCGRTQEIEAPSVEKWARTVAAEYGYTDINHELELFGVCADCSTAGPAPGPAADDRYGGTGPVRTHGTSAGSSGADRLSVQSTTAGDSPDLRLQCAQPHREVGLGVVTGQVDVGHQVDLPRADELQPQGRHPVHLGQLQQRGERGRPGLPA